MSDNRPIGVVDSGIGGISVVNEIHRLMPGESVYYLGDTAHAPYGNRSDQWIREKTLRNTAFLLGHDVKILVVACSTMSAVTGTDNIGKGYRDTPIIGSVQPSAKAAVLRTAEKKVGVIGTRASIRSGAFSKSISEFDKDVKVFEQACPLLSSLVDEGFVDNDIARLCTEYYLYRQVNIGIDCLILASTQYPLLMEVIQETVGTRIQLIDTALWLAKEVQDILIALNGLSDKKDTGIESSRFFLTDTTWGEELPISGLLGKDPSMFESVKIDS